MDYCGFGWLILFGSTRWGHVVQHPRPWEAQFKAGIQVRNWVLRLYVNVVVWIIGIMILAGGENLELMCYRDPAATCSSFTCVE
jgi:hypothetical protein